MMSVALKRVERTNQKPHSALHRSLASSGSNFVGGPALLVLGGSARTLGNMNRPSIAVKAMQPAANEAQPGAVQVTRSGPTNKPRREVCGVAWAIAVAPLA